MNIPGLIITLDAGAVVARRRIVKMGSTDYQAVQAAAAGDNFIGVSTDVGASEAGNRIDVITSGVAVVEYGGTVEAGQKLTSNADGKAVTAAAGNEVIGTALIDGVDGDEGSVLIARHAIESA